MNKEKLTKILSGFNGLTLSENYESELSKDLHDELINEIQVSYLTAEDIYKTLKKNIVFDFQDHLDQTYNRIEKEIFTEWGLIHVVFVMYSHHDNDYNYFDLNDILDINLYNLQGSEIDLKLDHFKLFESLSNLSLKY